MKLETWRYICENCKKEFPKSELPGDEVCGEFILRSEKLDNEEYLNSFKDQVFDELSILVDSLLKNENESNRADIFQNIFGVTCDPDIDGSLFQITFHDAHIVVAAILENGYPISLLNMLKRIFHM